MRCIRQLSARGDIIPEEYHATVQNCNATETLCQYRIGGGGSDCTNDDGGKRIAGKCIDYNPGTNDPVGNMCYCDKDFCNFKCNTRNASDCEYGDVREIGANTTAMPNNFTIDKKEMCDADCITEEQFYKDCEVGDKYCKKSITIPNHVFSCNDETCLETTTSKANLVTAENDSTASKGSMLVTSENNSTAAKGSMMILIIQSMVTSLLLIVKKILV